MLVCNHVSFVDAVIIAAACRRPIRFVMDHGIFRIPVLNFIFRTSKTIPIASAKENPQLLEKAYDDIAAALANGDLVGIFPEGRITDTGELYPFRAASPALFRARRSRWCRWRCAGCGTVSSAARAARR